MRRKPMLLSAFSLVTLGMVLGLAQSLPAKRWNFDSDRPGEIAAGFKSLAGDWKVVIDDSAPSKPNVFAQIAQSGPDVFNIAWVEGVVEKDLDVQVAFKTIAGKVDQGGGLIWRAKAPKNYYLCRYNPIESNLRIYKVMNGDRIIIRSADDIEEKPGWQTLRVVTSGKRIEAHLNGEARLSFLDEAITEPGAIGLWSKADAQTHFDNFEWSKISP